MRTCAPLGTKARPVKAALLIFPRTHRTTLSYSNGIKERSEFTETPEGEALFNIPPTFDVTRARYTTTLSGSCKETLIR